MIERILLKDLASYTSSQGTSFAPTLINFIYGANGSGKTTISNVVENCKLYPNCTIDWGLTTPLTTLVYNRNFIESNFAQSTELKGIFTLGKESKAEIENIKTKQSEIDAKEKIIQACKGTLEQEANKLQTTENTFTEKCWLVQKKYEEIFLKAFEGFRGSKARFKEKVVSESISNKQLVLPQKDLENKANTILNSNAVRAPELKVFVSADFNALEGHSILQTRIIGKDDVDIAKMILKLNNSDWVRQGIEYYNANNNYCPFCQQITTEHFKKQLDEYFDKTYSQQIQTLKIVNEQYNLECQTLLKSISTYLELNNQFIDIDAVTSLKDLITTKSQKNILTLEKKIKEPTIKVEVDSIVAHINKLKELFDSAIVQTKEHNKIINNIETERKLLISNIWSFVINELKTEYQSYKTDKENNDKAIKGVTNKINSTQAEIKVLRQDIQKSESKITSIKPTIDAINRTLSSFGFKNFSLAESTTSGNYRIIRENGHDAKSTLSEGEKTFITFLYFFHLTSGSFETDKITSNKVLVIDDPISSLDSSVLFIVSNLVRQLISECRDNKSNIKQVFILTHNVYFHKEVTFKKRTSSAKGESFWIVRKISNNSTIEKYTDNPVQTSYDLLWQEIRDASKVNKLTVFNTLRRILEYYFKILGKIRDDELLNKFEGEEKSVSNALLSWINDGSHSINDDLFITADDETIEKYLLVFRKIFEIENQIEHYNMMMKIT